MGIGGMMALEEILKEMASHIPGIASIYLVSEEGLLMSHYSPSEPPFDPEEISAELAGVMADFQKAAERANMGKTIDVLFTTSQASFLLRALGDGSCFVGVSMKLPAGQNIGIARWVLKRYSDKLWEAMPK